jgi:CHAD domain-containing protein
MAARTNPPELLIRQRLNALSRALPGARDGDPALVHQARVATRRLRAALPLVARGHRGRRLERDARRLTRALGAVRELDVALEMLEALAASAQAPRGALARLRQLVREERQRMFLEMCRQVGRVNVDKLRRRASAAGKRATRRSDPQRITDAQLRAARRAVRLRQAIEDAAGIYLPDRLHEVRVAVKKLRYAMEVWQDLSGSKVTARIRTLKEAQDLLGRMHDHEVLIARVRGVQGSKAPNLRLSADLDRLVRTLETECRQVHGQYMVLRRKLLAIADVTAAGGTASLHTPHTRRRRASQRTRPRASAA